MHGEFWEHCEIETYFQFLIHYSGAALIYKKYLYFLKNTMSMTGERRGIYEILIYIFSANQGLTIKTQYYYGIGIEIV